MTVAAKVTVMNKNARLVFDKWKANFTKKPNNERTTKNAQINFEELFYEMKRYQISFEDAQDVINDAVAVHMPPMFLVDKVYTTMKADKKTSATKQEFASNWRTTFEEAANSAFYTWYEIPLASDPEFESPQKASKIPDAEYIKQRALADSFESISEEDIQQLKENRERVVQQNLDDLLIDLG